MPSKSNNIGNINNNNGNNECNSTTIERHLISPSSLASSFGTPPPVAAQLLKEERPHYSSTSLSTTSSFSSMSTLVPEFGIVSGTISNRPTPLSSLKCEASSGSGTSTPSTCLLSPNSSASSIKHTNGNGLKDLEFKASLYNSTSNSTPLLTAATSINSLAAKYFDAEVKPVLTSTANSFNVGSTNFSKKALKQHDKVNGLPTLKDAALINVDTIKLEAAAALVNGNNDRMGIDLEQLAAAAKVAKFDTMNSKCKSAFHFPGLINSSNNVTETTIESVKTMECDSSVPSPPKVNDQHLSISVNCSGSSASTEKSEIGWLLLKLF